MLELNNVLFSTLDYKIVKTYLNIEEDFCLDDELLRIATKSAKSYVKKYTQLSDETLNEYPDLVMAVLKISSDFYHNRSAVSSGSTKYDLMLDLILKNSRTYNI